MNFPNLKQSLIHFSLENHNTNADRMLLRPRPTVRSKVISLLSRPFVRKQTMYEKVISMLFNVPFRRRQTLRSKAVSFLSDVWRNPYAWVLLGLICLVLLFPRIRSILTHSRLYRRLRRCLRRRPIARFNLQSKDPAPRKDGAPRARAPAAKNKVSAWWKSL